MIEIVPPVAPDDAPALRIKAPPDPLLPDPTDIVIDPPRPLLAAPVPINIAPLFPDVEWSRPEQRTMRGRLGIIGGNKLGFAGVAEAYTTALQAGAGEVRVLLPDILKKTMKYIESVEGEPDQLHQLTDIVTTLTATILEGSGNIRPKTVETPVAAPTRKTVETAKKATPIEEDSTMGSIIDKMRSITSDRKMENKFFKKPTKK